MRSFVLASLLLCAGAARADTLTSTLGQPLREVSHTVDMVVKDGVATCTVRRVFANDGTVADEAGLEIDLPYGAAATGLRIRARTRWYDGELLEAQEAARRYQEMTGFGSHQAKDPALLQWVWADKLSLQVFPVFPGAASTVEYTLTVPTRYQRGQVFVSYPHVAAVDHDDDEEVAGATSALPLAVPVITVRPSWADAVTPITIDGRTILSETPVVLSAPAAPAWAERLGVSGDGAVLSSLVVPDVLAHRMTIDAVTVDVDIDHTYRTDLRLQLVTPADELVAVDTASADASLSFKAGESGENDLRGRFTVKLPGPRSAVGTWRLLVEDVVARDAGTLTSWSVSFPSGAAAPEKTGGASGPVRITASDTPLFIPDARESESDGAAAVVAIAGPAVDVLSARLGKVVASPEHAFSRLEIDAAPQLAPLPKKAQLVYVVDASHSMGEDGIAVQLALLRAELTHIGDAEVEVVVYRRRAERLFQRFVPAAEVEGWLAHAQAAGSLAPGNGSALDEGVKVAVDVLADRRGPLHLVLLSDELLRPAFQMPWLPDALAALPGRAVVHVVIPEIDGSDEIHLRRDDDAALAVVTRGHHGIMARIDGLPADQKKLAPVVLGLVRPVQIDGFTMTGLPESGRTHEEEEEEEEEKGGVLHEGDGRRIMVHTTRASDRVVLTGRIWGDPFRRVVGATAAFSRATAAFVFGEDEHGELSDEEMMRVARLGRAVSPVTSYLATEPGVRPSTIGLQRGGIGGLGAGGLGMRGSGFGGGGSARRPPDLKHLVDAAPCIDAHGSGTVILDVDTTEDEVVDVAVTRADNVALGACLAEAVWAVRLTADFNLEREHFNIGWR
jgi:subtilisin-like proprotein convertase family protein